jgi:hypothetical protein
MLELWWRWQDRFKPYRGGKAFFEGLTHCHARTEGPWDNYLRLLMWGNAWGDHFPPIYENGLWRFDERNADYGRELFDDPTGDAWDSYIESMMEDY